MSTEKPRPEGRAVAALLQGLGVRDSSEFALDRTITPGTFSVSTPSSSAGSSSAGSSSAGSSSAGSSSAGSSSAGSSSAGPSLPSGPVDATLASGPAGRTTSGPLPRIALSGQAVRASAQAAAAGDAPADFEVIRMLGEGGMGRVHLARQRSLGRDVAIKSLKDEVADTRSAEMLRSEATVMGRLEHPNVVPVHAVGLDENGRLVLVMKRIDGVSWTDLLREPAHPRWAALLEAAGSPLEVHLDVLAAIARALHFAHEHGVIHRDVKPDNVLVGSHGDVYLADWGVALRLSDAGTETELVGTPAYMAREMVVGDPRKIDARTDVYLLGACLHEVLTGKPPHNGKNLHQILITAYDAEPPVYGPEVPTELAAIAKKALAADPEERFSSALAFRRALDDVRRHRGSIALARSGHVLLGELEGATLGDSQLDRKLTEARFAFVQALRDWPDNQEARTGLEACLRRAIAHELARDNPSGARALLGELLENDAALEEAVRVGEAKHLARERERERLKALEAEQDLSVGQRARNVVVALLILFSLGISALVAWQTGQTGDAISGHELILISTVFVTVVCVPLVFLRKWLLANLVSRRIASLVVFSTLLLLAHRIAGVAMGVDASAILVMDTVLFAGICAAGGAVVPRLIWALPVPLLGGALCWAFPDAVAPLFSTTGVLTVVVLTALLLSAQRQGGKSAEPGP